MPVHLAVFLSRRFHGAVSPAPLAAAPFGALLLRAGEAALRFPLNFGLRLVRSYLVQGLCDGPVGRWATIRGTAQSAVIIARTLSVTLAVHQKFPMPVIYRYDKIGRASCRERVCQYV